MNEILTVFVISTQRKENYRECINSLKSQTMNFNLIEIKDISPMPVAFNRMIELYNHSYYHLLNNNTAEFTYTSYKYQLESINKTQEIIQKHLNYKIRVFGAVANSISKKTMRIIEHNKDLTHLYYYLNYKEKIPKIPNKKAISVNGYGYLELNIDNFSNENQKILDLQSFIFNFEKFQENPIIYQLHPQMWNNRDFLLFEQILNYLISINTNFIFPTEIL